jgi:hypothetical protein
MPIKMPVAEMFIVLREPAEARSSGWQNKVTNWFDDEQMARDEAERLCRQHGKRYLVLKALAYVEPREAPVAWAEGAYDPSIVP